MNEKEREETIKKIINILMNTNKIVEYNFDWNDFISNKVKENYEECKDLFDIKEQEIMNNLLLNINIYLKDNKFAFIHNDLHFDNIIVNNEKLYLIDFNDSGYAPIDYELRILFMCNETPWKWANTEMDPLQKSEDYKNIIKYILKYYKELNNVNYLNERMIIYRIYSEIRNLPRFRNKKNKDFIINYAKKLLCREI